MRASQRFFTKLHLPVAALIGFIISGLSSADTLHITDDTFIDLSQPTTTNGDSLGIQVNDTAGVQQGFVRFDLSTLPASTVDADIDSATLRFWVKDVINSKFSKSADGSATMTWRGRGGYSTLTNS